MSGWACVLVCTLVWLSVQSASGAYTPNLKPFNASTSFYSSYYGGGNCFQQPSKTDTMLIAPTTDNFDMYSCGQCYDVTGPNGKTVNVRIFDSCPTNGACSQAWTLNGYSDGPYTEIGCVKGNGKCNIVLQLANCDVSRINSGKIQLYFETWNNQYSFGVVPSNILVRVETMYINYTQINTTNPRIACPKLTAQNDPGYACPGNPNYIQFPYTLTVCSYLGECLSQTFSEEYKNKIIETNIQFTKGYNGALTTPAPSNSVSTASITSSTSTRSASTTTSTSSIPATTNSATTRPSSTPAPTTHSSSTPAPTNSASTIASTSSVVATSSASAVDISIFSVVTFVIAIWLYVK